jgi:hypothetical protein
MQVIDYTILSAQTSHDLEELVKQHLAEGWQPQGGASVAAYESTMGPSQFEDVHRFCQAMVKYGA